MNEPTPPPFEAAQPLTPALSDSSFDVPPDVPIDAPTDAPDRRWTGRDVLSMVLAMVGAFIGGMVALSVLLAPHLRNGQLPKELGPVLALGGLGLEATILIGGVYFFGLRRRGFTWADVGLGAVDSSWIKISLMLGVLCTPLFGLLGAAVRWLLGRPLENPQVAMLQFKGLPFATALTLALLVGIVVPFAEELFFRGVFYAWLRDRWNVRGATIVSAALFGLVHFEPSISVATFALGLLLATVYERSRSLWTSFIIHAANNSLAVLLLYTVSDARSKII